MKLKDPTLLRTDAYINGAWVSAADGRVFGVHNPANGALIALQTKGTVLDARGLTSITYISPS